MNEQKIKLYTFFRCWDIPSANPPCMKLETFLRMADINYDIQFLATLLRAPNGKVPYVGIDSEIVSDSTVIIRQLSINNERTFLTQDDSGIAIPISKMLQDQLYWVLLYSRFVDPSEKPNWKDECREIPTFKTKPSILISFIFSVLQ